jgi:hypothetical protein
LRKQRVKHRECAGNQNAPAGNFSVLGLQESKMRPAVDFIFNQLSLGLLTATSIWDLFFAIMFASKFVVFLVRANPCPDEHLAVEPRDVAIVAASLTRNGLN